uniref:Aminopeptidase n=1 Tax=uncultured Flavobacteriia bacterium TaxID=212695 RepID=H6RFV2_9BACT|nr:aminopeptidase [uncultured bacterium]CCF99913.1 aminopeptidase [uncultured Flavobacteriia bacterium]
MRSLWTVSLILFIGIIGFFGDLIWFGVQQGIGQSKILLNTEEVSDVLNDPATADSVKTKLNFIEEVRRYAQDSLGLNDSENYTSFYDQKGKDLLWVVQACPEFSLEANTWYYGFLGRLPYRGYFDSLRCAKLGKKLWDEGYDVDVSPVEAWSTLGWFRDPILSNMLDKDEGMLARLVIHELTHATLYVESDAEFNENLATFVGDQGTYLFLENRYGRNSEEYQSYSDRMNDLDLFVEAGLAEYERLEALYASFTDDMRVWRKRQLKQVFFQNALKRMKQLPFNKMNRFKMLAQDSITANNTILTGLGLYKKQQNTMDSSFRANYDSDFDLFIAGMKKEYGKE